VTKIPAVSFPIVTVGIPDRGSGRARPVRTYEKDGFLIEEFEIESGPRKGHILTLKTRIR
jgi:hypothetical protein